MGEIAQAHQALIDDINRTQTAPGQGAFWWLGQHSVVVKVANTICWIDPWMEPSESRNTPPLVSPDEITNADLVLITHGHGDHLCPYTLKGILKNSPDALYFAPKSEGVRLTEEVGIDPSQLTLLKGDDGVDRLQELKQNLDLISVQAVPAKHEQFHYSEANGYPNLGYVLSINGLVIYHSGDTIRYDGQLARLQAFPPIDAAFLPINGRNELLTRRGWEGNFTYQEAVELAGDLRVGLAVPTHYDMFEGNTEDPAKFTGFLDAKYPGVASWVGPAGTRVLFGLSSSVSI